MPRTRADKTPPPPWAKALKLRRINLDKTQEEIAAASGDVLSQGSVTDLERGRISLDKMETRRVAALAKALDWSLYELQQATGIDLGIDAPSSNVEDAPLGVRVRIFPLSEASKPVSQWQAIPDRFVKMLPEEHNPNLKIFFQGEDPDTNGTLYYVLTNEKNLHIGQFYLIVHNETALVCEYKPFSNQGIFVHNGAFISPQEAQVIGLCHQQICKRTPTPPQN